MGGWAWLPISEMADSQVDWLRKSLTVADVRRRKPVLHRAYVEDGDRIGIPRSFLRDSSTKDHYVEDLTSDGGEWPSKVLAGEGVLWGAEQDDDFECLTLIDSVSGDKTSDFFSSDQRRAIDAILRAVALYRDGIAFFRSEQSAAKVCLSLIRTIRRRTLVVTPPGISFSMWETVIGRFLPDARTGFIRRDERDDGTSHITLTTVDYLTHAVDRGDVSPDEYGFVISHHIHRMDPIEWARGVGFLNAGRRLGITEPSFSLTEGLSRIYSYHLGSPVFAAKSDSTIPGIRRVESGWRIGTWDRVNPQFISKASILNHICVNSKYNKSVVDQVILALKAGRKVAIFSDKVTHLKALDLLIDAAWSGSTKEIDYIVDGMSSEEIERSSRADIILTTFEFAKSFPEIPELDTVVLATPVRDPLLAANVCRLRDPDKKDPVIVDMRCDGVPVCKDYGRSRDDAYAKIYGA